MTLKTDTPDHRNPDPMGTNSIEQTIRFHHRVGLLLARCCISAWIGAAALFVVVGILEVTRGGFDSTTKDMLVAVRFPAFYVFGAVLIGSSWLGTWLTQSEVQLSKTGRRITLVLLSIVLMLMIVDYLWIYQPLLAMVTPPGQSKPASFVTYHEASKTINLVGLLISMITMAFLNWPSSTPCRFAPQAFIHQGSTNSSR